MAKKCGLYMALLAIFCFSVTVGVGDSWAGLSGKVRGVVKDSQGNPLPGANVVVEGTRLGATADADGFYVILSVDPGEYTLVATLIGFEKQTSQGVRVRADYTTVQDFALRETTLEAAELVVTATRPLVETDQTASRYVVSAEDIKQVPMVREVNDIAALQPGVEADGSNVIRGGNQSGWSRDVTYLVDGVRMVHTDGGSSNASGLFRSVNASAIQEMQVIVGAMEAEYGNVQGGVVNIVLREGARRFGGSSEYKMSPPGQKHWGYNLYDQKRFIRDIDPTTLRVDYSVKYDDPEWAGELFVKPGPDGQYGTDDDERRLAHEVVEYTKKTGHRLEGMVNGPITSQLSFIATTGFVHEVGPYPGPEQWGYYTREGAELGQPGYAGGFVTAPFNLRSSAKLSYRLADNMSLRTGAVIWRTTDYQPTATTGGTTELFRGGQGNGSEPFFLTGRTSRGKRKTKDDIYYLSFQHTVSPRTYYEARLSNLPTVIDTADVPLQTTPIMYDKEGRFAVDKDDHRYVLVDRNRWQFKFDLSSQVTKGHFLKTGMEFKRYSSTNYSFNLNSEEQGAGVGGGSQYPMDSTVKYKNDIRQADFSVLSGNGLPIGRGGTPFKPMQFAAYVQDKMEFQGMVMNVGVRLDALWVRTTMTALPGSHATPMFNQYGEYMAVRPGFDPITDVQNSEARYLPIMKAKGMYQISPRLGVSHPITDRSLIRFAFGRFFQVPTFSRIYSASWSIGSGSRDDNGDGVINDNEWFNQATGNGPQWQFVKAEQTYNMEAGVDWNFVSDYTVSLATYYKSASDQQARYPPSNTIFDPSGNRTNSYAGSPPDGFEDSRGIELSFRKAFSNYFSFTAAYNATWRTGSNTNRSVRQVVPDSLYVMSGLWWNTWAATPDGRQAPVIPDEATRAVWGHNANEELRRLRGNVNYAEDKEQPIKGIYTFHDVAGADPSGPSGAEIVQSTYPGTANGDRRHSASMTVTFATPERFGPIMRGFHLLGGLRANIVYRFLSGIPYPYINPTSGKTETRYSTIQTQTDLSITRSFAQNRKVRADVFFEARNLFNQQNYQLLTSSAHPPPTGWDLYGWPLASNPDSDFIRKFGEFDTRGLLADQPRIVELGVRLFW